MAEGLRLEPAPGVAVRWDLRSGDELPAWSLDGELEPGLAALRLLSARLDDGRVLLLAAARPDGAEGHDAETTAAVIVDPEGGVSELEEILLSTEYAEDGRIRRLGLELYPPGEDYPHRGGAEALSAERREAAGRRTDSAEMGMRLDGVAGSARYEIVRDSG